MSETDISTTAKYYDYVNFTVDCIIEEIKEKDVQYIDDLVFQHIDSADIMIYNGYELDILENSRNEPEEWKHMVSECDYWREVLNAMAFTVFQQDIYEKLNEKGIDV